MVPPQLSAQSIAHKAQRRLAFGGTVPALSHAQIADTLYFLHQNAYSSKQLQSLTGYKDYTIRHYFRIAKKLVPAVKALLHEHKISFSLARTLVSLAPTAQEEQARQAIMHRISVHRLRRKLSDAEGVSDSDTHAYFERLADVIAQQTGLLVHISPDKTNKQAGKMILRYTDLQGFDAICTRLNLDLE